MLRSSGKKKLSKNVLEMKFMKRTKEKTEIEAENEERQAMFANSITTAMKHQGSRFITEPSYVNIENLTFGRLAFNGMNPEIEKMAEDDRAQKEEAESDKREKDVQDEEMLEYYSNVSNTVNKKFATKRSLAGGRSSNNSEMKSDANPDNLLHQGQKYVQNMRQQSHTWKKDQNFQKRRKMIKPSLTD